MRTPRKFKIEYTQIYSLIHDFHTFEKKFGILHVDKNGHKIITFFWKEIPMKIWIANLYLVS